MAIALIDYGAGNLHSVANALKAAGADNVRITADPADLNDWRLAAYKAFRDANPGPGSFPTPGTTLPRSLATRRDVYLLVTAGAAYCEVTALARPEVPSAQLAGTLDRFAERIGRQLFKLAVEQNVNNHILASDTDIDVRSYQKMRGLSMDEVKRTNGRIDFEDALLSERGV